VRVLPQVHVPEAAVTERWRSRRRADAPRPMESVDAPHDTSEIRAAVLRFVLSRRPHTDPRPPLIAALLVATTLLPMSHGAGAEGFSRDEAPRAAALVSSGNVQAARRSSSGTGFFVDGHGNVLTNHHVVETCRQIVLIAADKRWRAQVVARDAILDLALVKVDRTSVSYATFRANVPPRAGESVTAVGFPLRGLLASEPNVSTGIVNAVAGIRDDASRFQISAPVQSGNSGGPVLDAGGNVIGVVVSKLDAMKVARETGDMPQNINFAIKGDVARAFLAAHGIPTRTGAWARSIDTIGVAAIAKAMTVAVECR